MNAIDIRNICKSYKEVEALKNINIQVPEKSIFGFLGPNGSGKTTTVRIVNGILNQDSGSAKIYDFDTQKNSVEIRKIVGVMTESAKCYENYSAKENLLLYARLHEVKEKFLSSVIDDTLKKVDLFEEKNKKVKHFSTGMKKRMAMAIAIVHNPKVLFLDEPTSGLDPQNALMVTDLIKNLVKEKGVTVFLCTHQLEYAEKICTNYGFVKKGTIIAQGDYASLLEQRSATKTLIIRGKNINNGFVYDKDKEIYYREVKDDLEVARILKKLGNSDAQVYEATQKKWDLEKLYFSFFGGDKI